MKRREKMGGYIRNRKHFVNFITKYIRDHNVEIMNEKYFIETMDDFYDKSEEIKEYLQRAPYDVMTWYMLQYEAYSMDTVFNKKIPEIISETNKFYNGGKDIHFKYLKEKSRSTKIYFDANNVDHLKKYTEETEIVLNSLQGKPGIYFLYKDEDDLIYIGKSINLGSRIPTSIKEQGADSFAYIITETPADRHLLEPYFILKYAPSNNTEFIDKSSVSFELNAPERSKIIKLKE